MTFLSHALTPAPTGMDALGKHDFSILLMPAGVHRARTVERGQEAQNSARPKVPEADESI